MLSTIQRLKRQKKYTTISESVNATKVVVRTGPNERHPCDKSSVVFDFTAAAVTANNSNTFAISLAIRIANSGKANKLLTTTSNMKPKTNHGNACLTLIN